MYLKDVVRKIINTGSKDIDSSIVLRRVKTLNLCVFIGLLNTFFFLGLDYYNDNLTNYRITVIVVEFFSFLTIFLLHYRYKIFLAKVVFMVVVLFLIFLKVNLIFQGFYAEYNYVIVPLLSLFFFDKKYIHYLFLIISIAAFYFSNYVFGNTPEKYQGYLNVISMFIGVFVIVNYFVTLNRKNEKRLQELHKFQAQFFVNVSHEIRTPLTLILGYNKQMQNLVATSTNPLVHKAMQHIDKQSMHIQKIVDDVIDLAKLEASALVLHKENVVISDFIARIYESFKMAFFQKQIDFTYINDTKNTIVEIDVLYIERAITNILHNALKYTDANKQVVLEVFEKENQIYITIKDQGIGIAQKDLKAVFNRFYQVSNDINTSGGSGVGLAFSKEIIELHAGKITVVSALEKGTTFSIILPKKVGVEAKDIHNIIKKTQDIDIALKGVDLPLVPTNATILLVEDHLQMRAYIKQVLSCYTCLEAANGQEALDILTTEKVDLVITDYMMPKIDGYTLVKLLKQKDAYLPILMLTARSESSTKLDILRFGVNDYMQKPFVPEELLLRVHNILGLSTARKDFIKEHSIVVAPAEKQIILDIKAYIEANISKSLSIVVITEHFSISKSTLYRLLKAETGLTPNAFIKEIRLQCARKYVEQQKYDSVKSLAYAVGYNKPDYFSTLYKKRFQVGGIF